ELESKNVIVPPSPGITCAQGMIIADVRHDYVKSFISNTVDVKIDSLNDSFEALEETAMQTLSSQGFGKEKSEIHKIIDLRYKGQAYDLSIKLGNEIDKETMKKAVENFHEEHEKIYGF